MPWYRTGTISVTNNSTAVTGAGTTWVSGVGIGEALYGPDGKIYEIANVVSDTSITLASAYQGTTAGTQNYVIVPSQSYIRDLAAQAAQLVADYGNTMSSVGQGKFADGTLAAPGVRFTSDENTGIRRAGVDDLRLVAGGVDQLAASSSGLTYTGGTTKATPVDADVVVLADSAASNILKKLTWANLKATLKTWIEGTSFASLSASGTGSTPLVITRTGATGVYQQFTDSSGSSVYVGASSGTLQIQTPSGGYSTKVAVSDTGLAVTGALSATGGFGFNLNSGGTAMSLASIVATPSIGGLGSGLRFGWNDDANGPAIRIRHGGSYNEAGIGFQTWEGGALVTRGELTSAGLAVTGALSATGATGTLNVTSSTLANPVVTLADSSGRTAIFSGPTSPGIDYARIGTTTGHNLALVTANTVKATLDTSGNLGLGVTPSAWGSGSKAMELPSGAALSSLGGYSILYNNAYHNGSSYVYKATGTASAYQTGGGAHYWFTAPSGTAGNAISFGDPKMTLDASGNLAVGDATASGHRARFKGATTDSTAYSLVCVNSAGTNMYYVRNDGFAVWNNNAMTLDASGNLGIGTSSPGDRLEVVGSGAAGIRVSRSGVSNQYVTISSGSTGPTLNASSSVGAVTLGVNSSFLATLDSSGNLGLGVTPSAWASLYKSIDVAKASSHYGFWDGTTSIAGIANGAYVSSSYAWTYSVSGQYVSRYSQDDGAHKWFTAPSGTAGNAISFGDPKMMLDASGNLLLNTASFALSDSNSVMVGSNTGTTYLSHVNGTGSGTAYENFVYNSGYIGSITQSGTTAVAYNTTSDHRLKENVRPADAARFMDIEFVDFEWVDGRHDCGVIAHQLASVYPDLVLGAKDATEVRTVEITPAVPAVTERRLVTPAIPAVVAVEARAAVEASPAEYTTVTTDEVVLIDGVETTITRTKLVETKPAVEAQPAVEAVAAVEAVEAVYEDVVITPAVPAVTEEQTFPVYQQVNYIGLIGRMGTRLQQLQRTVDALETRLAALEANV